MQEESHDGGETRWLLLRANPGEASLRGPGTPDSRLAFSFVPLTLYHRLLSSSREFTSTDRLEDRHDSLSPVMRYESTRIKTRSKYCANRSIEFHSVRRFAVYLLDFQGFKRE